MGRRRAPVEGGAALRVGAGSGEHATQVDTSLVGPDGPLGTAPPQGSGHRDDLLPGSAPQGMPEWLLLTAPRAP